MPSILLVADDEWVENDVAAAVSDPSTKVATCHDPREAANRVADELFDLVIVDLQVRSMGGMAIVRLLEDAIADGEVERVPIVMLLDRAADAFLARRAGADAYLVKPFTSQDLRAAIASLVPAGR